MSFLDELFGNTPQTVSTPTAGTPSALPPMQSPSAQVLPSYADFYKAYTGAINNRGYFGNIEQHGLLGAIGQTGRDLASAPYVAPDLYLKMLQAQQGAQGQKLANQGNALHIAQTRALLQGQGLIPGAPPVPGPALSAPSTSPPADASAGPPPVSAGGTIPTAAPAAAPPPVPVGAPPVATGGLTSATPPVPVIPGAVPAAAPPQAGAPVDIPLVKGVPPVVAPPAVGVDPLQARRAFLMQKAAAYSRLPDYLPQALQMMQAARAGIPPGTDVNGTGQIVDAVTRQPITTDTQTYAATGAGKIAGAQGAAAFPYTIASQNNQAANQRATDAARIAGEAKNKTVAGFDVTTGQPATATEYDIAHGKAPNFRPGANPYFVGQQEELKGLRANASSADQGLQLAVQIQNAANGIYTGKGAEVLQGARKLAQAAAAITHQPLPTWVNNDTSKFEQLKYAAQQLVGIASHAISPRVAQNIYAQIAAVKPGDQTSIKGLRDIITNEIIPAMAREKGMFGATAAYYKAHPLSNDAAAVVPGQLDINGFRVKTDLHAVQPGDYYLDPASGNIRQRPVK